jgi:hypothetical protein
VIDERIRATEEHVVRVGNRPTQVVASVVRFIVESVSIDSQVTVHTQRRNICCI